MYFLLINIFNAYLYVYMFLSEIKVFVLTDLNTVLCKFAFYVTFQAN